MKTEDLRKEYERIQAIREWNAKFRTPPVCTAGWHREDFDRWYEARKPLPPFEEWKKKQKTSLLKSPI